MCMLGRGYTVALIGHVCARKHLRVEIISARNMLFPRGTYYCREGDIISARKILFPRDMNHFRQIEFISKGKKSFARGRNRFREKETISPRRKQFARKKCLRQEEIFPQERKIFARMDLTPRGRNFPAWRICPHHWVEWITGWMLVVWNIAIGYKHNLCHAKTISSSRKWFLPRRRDIFLVEEISFS